MERKYPMVLSICWALVGAAFLLSQSFLNFGAAFISGGIVTLFGGPIGAALVYLVPLTFMARQFMRCAGAKRWGGAALCAIPIAIGILVVLYGRLAGEVLHFRLKKQEYERIVSAAVDGRCEAARAMSPSPRYYADVYCEHPIVVIFPWGGYSSLWYGVVYNEDDDIHSTATSKSEARMWLSCSVATASLGGHYFLAGGYIGKC